MAEGVIFRNSWDETGALDLKFENSVLEYFIRAIGVWNVGFWMDPERFLVSTGPGFLWTSMFIVRSVQNSLSGNAKSTESCFVVFEAGVEILRWDEALIQLSWILEVKKNLLKSFQIRQVCKLSTYFSRVSILDTQYGKLKLLRLLSRLKSEQVYRANYHCDRPCWISLRAFLLLFYFNLRKNWYNMIFPW